MTPSHLTFTERNLKRGIFFYRMIALVNVCSSALLIFLFHYSLEGVNEFYWDRIICLLLSIYIYVLGFKESINTKKYIRLVRFLFYVQITQLIIAAGRNDFSTFYFMLLFVVQQSYAYCLRSIKEVNYYLAYAFTLTIISLVFISNIDRSQLSLYIFSSFLLALMQLLTSVVKSRFINDLKMNQGLLKTLVSKADMAVFLTDDTGIILDSNTRATELFGYEREELLGKDFKLLRKYYLSESEILKAYEELDKNKFWNAITVLLTKDGVELHVKISVAPVMNGQKRMLIYRVIDITAMKENEAKLIEAKERAEEAVRVKSQFLAMMSHEIRTPLNGVIATASMLTKTNLTSEQAEYVDTIKKSGQSLLMLINDILDFSKLESGKMTLDLHPNKLDEIVYDVSDLLRPYAEEKNIQLKIFVDYKNSDEVMIDGPKLKQVLLNLLGNALKFTPEGSVVLKMETVGIVQDTLQIRFIVSDTGIGIPEDKMHLLFKSFSQVDSSTSRKYGGTGLGLAISQQIVELMGGSISVESMVGEGTTFSFTIECKRAVAEEASEAKDQSVLPTIDYSSLRVLVADDNEINRQVFKYMLDILGMNADMAVNGIQVLELYEQKPYDLIFMDMQMPGMDGLEATRQLRAKYGERTRIVAVTANAFNDDREECLKVGMNAFLSKPFDHAQLTAVLSQLYSKELPSSESAA
ncbi:MAG TPA: ATP-binding protein [Flavobacteriales bacterium]